jgi:diguanylate cyclase (GGDEF)-like protein
MLKKIKISNSYISTSIIFLLSLILIIVFIAQLNIKYTIETYTRYDSVLINKLGQIRGNIQRYVKLKVLNSKNYNEVEKDITNHFNQINIYLQNNISIISEKQLIKFYDYYNELENIWKKIKTNSNEKELLNLSEKAWIIADKFTTFMAKVSEEKICNIKQKIYLLTISTFIIVLILFLIVYSLVRSGLEKATITEPMTQLFNRFHFENQIKYLYENYKNNKIPFSAMLIDIDNFKKINDTYGHHTGDEILKQVAKILKQETRKSDLVFRYGGEEFIILFPNSSLKNIKKVAERIRKAIENNVKIDNNPVTISAGIGEFNDKQISIEHFLHDLDNALYTAKRTGKNKIIPI